MDERQQVIDACEHNLFLFAKLLNPQYQYGNIHEDFFGWLQEPETERQLGLLPRAHLKSHGVAVYCTHRLTYKPWVTMCYLSAGEDLAKDQIYAIKNMMTSPTYRKYWPDHLYEDEGRREQWSAYSFNLDHPVRRERGIRDHSLIVKTVKSNAIGLHCDELILDDVVVPAFAHTMSGRAEVNRALSQFTSILNPGGKIKAVGTRYHPEDAYQNMIEARVPIWNAEESKFDGDKPLWEVFERVVEDAGNGTGRFLWPRVVDPTTGEGYGFDPQTLATIRAEYESKGEKVQFYCQYYNDPNAIDTQRIDRGHFQYFDRGNLEIRGTSVYAGGQKLNVFAAMDVAWSDGSQADYTAIVVVGLDADGFIYVLDLSQFKTSNFSEYYKEVIDLHRKWGFKTVRVETNAGGKFVEQELERLIRSNGDILAVDGKAAVRGQGSKRERHAATLEWRYDAKTIWHYKGGHTPELEDQVILDRPRHDDLVDALCAAIEISKVPGKRARQRSEVDTNIQYDRRFGGRRSRTA